MWGRSRLVQRKICHQVENDVVQILFRAVRSAGGHLVDTFSPILGSLLGGDNQIGAVTGSAVVNELRLPFAVRQSLAKDPVA